MLKVLTLFISLLTSLSIYSSVQVVRYKGDILINSKKYDKTIKIKIGDTVHAKGDRSFIHMKTSFGSNITLRDGSLKVEKTQSKSTVMNLISGKFYHYLKPGTKRKFTLKTKNAVLGIRGTKYYVEAKDDDTYLCVCEGSVEATSLEKILVLNKNEDVHLNKDKKSSKFKASPQMISNVGETFSEMGFALK